MNLGTQTNSLVNHIHAISTKGQPAPVAGMGVTLLHWTDRSPGTVFRVFTVGKSLHIEVRADHVDVTSPAGEYGTQPTYAYRVNVNGSRDVFRLGKLNRWEHVRKSETSGRWIKTTGPGLRLGKREKYHDFSF